MGYIGGISSLVWNIASGEKEYVPIASSRQGIVCLLLMLFARAVAQTPGVGEPYEFHSVSSTTKISGINTALLPDGSRFTIWKSGTPMLERVDGVVISSPNKIVGGPFPIMTGDITRKQLNAIPFETGVSLTTWKKRVGDDLDFQGKYFTIQQSSSIMSFSTDNIFSNTLKMNSLYVTNLGMEYFYAAVQADEPGIINYRAFRDLQVGLGTPKFPTMTIDIGNRSIESQQLIFEGIERFSLFWKSISRQDPLDQKLKLQQFNEATGMLINKEWDFSFTACGNIDNYSLSKIGPSSSVVVADCNSEIWVQYYFDTGLKIGVPFRVASGGKFPKVGMVNSGALITYLMGNSVKGVVFSPFKRKLTSNFAITELPGNPDEGSFSLVTRADKGFVSYIDGQKLVEIEIEMGQLPGTVSQGSTATTDILLSTISHSFTPTQPSLGSSNAQATPSKIEITSSMVQTSTISSTDVNSETLGKRSASTSVQPPISLTISTEGGLSTALIGVIAAAACAVLSSLGVTICFFLNKGRQNVDDESGNHCELDIVPAESSQSQYGLAPVAKGGPTAVYVGVNCPLGIDKPSDPSQYDRPPPPHYREIPVAKDVPSEYDHADSPLS